MKINKKQIGGQSDRGGASTLRQGLGKARLIFRHSVEHPMSIGSFPENTCKHITQSTNARRQTHALTWAAGDA